ncbi:MAG: Gfo/Idh/MocA family protein [Aureliella sp.]
MSESLPESNASNTRRTFLQTAAAGAAGGSLLLHSPLMRSVHAAGGDSTLKVALIGCGGRGTGAAVQALSTEGPVKLWAMADAFDNRLALSLKSLQQGLPARYDRDKTDSLASKIDVPAERQFVGLDAYRQAIDSGVDVVILTGPPGFRPQHFEYAVQAGKHVFMEKPVATDPHGIRRVLAAAKQAKEKNLKVGVGLQRHHQASYQEAIRRIHDGEIGDIISLRCFWNTAAPAKTPVGREESVSELQHQVRNWYFFDWLSGDHICEQHVHNLDVCNWVKGTHPIKAEGMGGRQVRTDKKYGNIYDHHAVLYTYPDGSTMQSYCRQIPGCQNKVAEIVDGAKGSADLDSVRCSLTSGGKAIWQSKRGGKNPYQVENDDLYHAIRNDLPYNEAENGAMSTMTAIIGRMATYSGQAIDWEKAMASELRLTTDAEDWSSQAPIQPLEDGGYRIATPGKTKVM